MDFLSFLPFIRVFYAQLHLLNPAPSVRAAAVSILHDDIQSSVSPYWSRTAAASLLRPGLRTGLLAFRGRSVVRAWAPVSAPHSHSRRAPSSAALLQRPAARLGFRTFLIDLRLAEPLVDYHLDEIIPAACWSTLHHHHHPIYSSLHRGIPK